MRWVLGAIGLVALGVAWFIVSVCVPGGFVPDPALVTVRFIQLLPGTLSLHVLASLGRMAIGLAGAVALGVPAGIALGRVRVMDRIFAPVAYILFPVPKIALLPVIMLLFGLGNISKALVVFLVLFFQVLVAARDGAREVPAPYLLSMRSLGAGRRQTLRFVIMPALLPTLLSSLRIGIGTALAVLFFAETFGTTRGLGWFVMECWMRMSYVDMFAGIMCLGLLGLALFLLIDVLHRHACRWQRQI